jgi:hypothetical protein
LPVRGTGRLRCGPILTVRSQLLRAGKRPALVKKSRADRLVSGFDVPSQVPYGDKRPTIRITVVGYYFLFTQMSALKYNRSHSLTGAKAIVWDELSYLHADLWSPEFSLQSFVILVRQRGHMTYRSLKFLVIKSANRPANFNCDGRQCRALSRR